MKRIEKRIASVIMALALSLFMALILLPDIGVRVRIGSVGIPLFVRGVQITGCDQARKPAASVVRIVVERLAPRRAQQRQGQDAENDTLFHLFASLR